MGGNESQVLTLDYLGVLLAYAPAIPGVSIVDKGNEVEIMIVNAVPDNLVWLGFIVGSDLNLWQAPVSSKIIVQGTSYINNPLHRLFAPRVNQKFDVALSLSGIPQKVTLCGAAQSHGDHKLDFEAVEVSYRPESRFINVTLFGDRHNSVSLSVRFIYKSSQPYAPTHKAAESRTNTLRTFTGVSGSLTTKSSPTSVSETPSPALMSLSLLEILGVFVLLLETSRRHSRLLGTVTSNPL